MEHKKEEPLYSISVASNLTGISPRVLRSYEEAHLITPYRTRGNTRLFSSKDIQKINLIVYLQKEKEVNLSGIKAIFHILAEMSSFCEDMEKDKELIDQLKSLAPDI